MTPREYRALPREDRVELEEYLYLKELQKVSRIEAENEERRRQRQIEEWKQRTLDKSQGKQGYRR